jgi:hypothetical protein
VTPDIDAIVTADRAAQREIESVRARLDERVRLERERLERDRAAEKAAADARVEAEAAAVERESLTGTERRRADRVAARAARRARAADAVPAAVSTYVAIVGRRERER